MDRNQFHQLLTNFTTLSSEEAQQLVALQHQYPFSQVLHGILARGAQDQEWINKNQYLQTSAVYCTDRAVLKSLMTIPQKPRKVTPEKKVPIKAAPQPATEITKPQPVPKSEATDHSIQAVQFLTGDALYNEVMHDIQILKERKLQFEMTANKLEKKIMVTSAAGLKPKKGKVQPDPDEGLLEEIKNSKKRVKPEGPKQKEQREIIDHFIKNQPSISKAKLATATAPKEDLAEPNVSLSDNIVSETLVEILIRQGKKDKAIEVLKKLIWKFPQKKAYFAAQIEDLKK